jgi:glucokinase
VFFSPNLGWRDVQLGQDLAKALKWPVYVANDVNMAALGELHYGAARGKRDVVTVHVGTGIGGGLIVNGQLYQGATGLAGELGQVSVQWNGPPCSGGNAGCAESYASGSAMIRRAQEAIAQGRDSKLKTMNKNLNDLSVECISEAEAAGDKLAHEIIADTGEIIGTLIANVINVMNPELVVVGGGVIRGVPQLMPLIEETVKRRALTATSSGCRVVHAHFGREAGVIGATVFAKLAGQPEKSHR